MRIAVTGASGLVGSELVPFLTDGGHSVTRLVRRAPAEGEIEWRPDRGRLDPRSLDGVNGVIHLGGVNIAARRWTPTQKQQIRDSRVEGTRVLCEGLANMKTPPQSLIAASAIGFYGDRGSELLNEQSAVGEGFLAETVRDWEAAAQPAIDAGIRVVQLRLGIVLSLKGGALAKMIPPFKYGAGGRVGSGRQYWSWISMDDVLGTIRHVLTIDSLAGPVNAVAPNPATNKQFTKALSRVLSRPAILPLPALAARLAFGEMANELLLSSARVAPQQLMATGFQFQRPTLEEALRHLVGKS